MIFNNINNLKEVKGLEENVLKALEYAINNDLNTYNTGTHYIDGKELFFNRVCYDTRTDDTGFWEGHRDYIDVHLILNGEERIDYNLINNLEKIDYKKDDDFASFNGDKKQSLILKKGDFAVFYPEDIHMTALMVNGKSTVNKVIFKVKL